MPKCEHPCVVCGKSTFMENYMVHNKVWFKEAGLRKGHCHLKCLEKLLKRKLTPKDFYRRLPVNHQFFFGLKMAKREKIPNNAKQKNLPKV